MDFSVDAVVLIASRSMIEEYGFHTGIRRRWCLLGETLDETPQQIVERFHMSQVL